MGKRAAHPILTAERCFFYIVDLKKVFLTDFRLPFLFVRFFENQEIYCNKH